MRTQQEAHGLQDQEGDFPQKPYLLAPDYSRVQNREKMNVYCLSPSVRGVLLWRPELTETRTINTIPIVKRKLHRGKLSGLLKVTPFAFAFGLFTSSGPAFPVGSGEVEIVRGP